MPSMRRKHKLSPESAYLTRERGREDTCKYRKENIKPWRGGGQATTGQKEVLQKRRANKGKSKKEEKEQVRFADALCEYPTAKAIAADGGRGRG